MKKILVLLALFSSEFLFAQDYEILHNAFKQSYIYEENSKFSEAINELQNVYTNDSYELNLRLGWLYYNNSEFVKSETYYKNAVKLLPYSEEAKFGLIMPLSVKFKWKEVAKIYKQILTISPNNTKANYNLGLIFYNKKDYITAYSLFEKVINLYPFDFDALYMFGWTSLNLGKKKEAKVIFNKLLMNNPTDIKALEAIKLVD